MAGFGADAIAVVTGGLRFSTGSFPDRLVSRGYIGEILTVLLVFTSLDDAEQWAVLKMQDGTYIVTHTQRTRLGVISVRALTYEDLQVATGGGDWIELEGKTQ